MSNRRVIAHCNHQEIRKGSKGYCHSRDYADTVFPLDFEICGKVKQVVSQTDLDDTHYLQKLACGHWDTIPKAVANENSKKSLSFDKLMPFQKQFIEFAEANNCQAFLADEMGLGKTPQSLVLVDQNGAKFTDNYTKYCLIIQLPGAIYQWNEEMDNFMSYMNPVSIDDLRLMPQTIFGTGQKLNEMALVIIIPWSKLGDKKLMAQIEKKGVGGIVVDECHYFKDANSSRTQNLIKIVKSMRKDAPKILLSGTPIENRIMEFFTAFNILDPEFFSAPSVLENMCLRDRKGKALGIAPWWQSRFQERISRFFLRRTKEQVGIPLPLNKDGRPAPQFEYVWLNPRDHEANEDIALAYDATLDELEKLLDNPAPDSGAIIGLMQQLRHHTGRMKILSAAMWIETWMMTHPGEKLAVGIHHKTVRTVLATLLKSRNPLTMSDEDAKEKDEIEKAFRNGKSNLLICSILSAGTGRNFQFCKNAVILERQWNRSKEDQFAQRFHRIIKDSEGRIRDRFTAEDMVTVYFLQAVNSFDEYFHELVDLKGVICDSTDDTLEDRPDVDWIMTLAQKVVQKRQKWVGI